MSNLAGRVVSLHLHPQKGGEPMCEVTEFEVVEQKGIRGNPRKFAVLSRSTGQPSMRQVTLMERERIAEHATVLGLPGIAPGAVRSNIETSGIDLIACVGQPVQVGDAVLLFYEPRTPCEKMERICSGLRALMENGRQGVLAQVLRSGTIRVGDAVRALPAAPA